MQVSNRKAIVIGGTSGIGLATARRLAAAGAEVVAASRDPGKAGDVGPDIRLVRCDARDADALQAFLAAEAPFDILVNAATGGERAVGPFLEMDMDGYKASFDKLWSYVQSVRFGVPHMPQDGAVVLVSGAPARKARPGQTALASVGGAVEAFAKAVARELRPVRINVVAPGIIDTPMVSGEHAEREAHFARITQGNLIQRPGTADEVADAILLAITNGFLTGTVIDVDGGWLTA